MKSHKRSRFVRALDAIRWHEWAVGKLCLGYTIVLFGVGLGDIDMGLVWSLLGLFFLVGLFGYLLNDWCDRGIDAAAGKRNVFSRCHPLVGIAFLVPIVCLLIVSARWTLTSTLQYALISAQVVLSWAYSSRPLRLKTRGLAGLMAVIASQYCIPICVLLTLTPNAVVCDWIVIIAYFLLHGLTLELGHQLFDRESDIRGHLATFASTKSAHPLKATYAKLLRIEAVAILLLPPYLVLRLAVERPTTLPVLLYLLPLGWISLELVIACRRYAKDKGIQEYDPYYGASGNCLDRWYTYFPNAFVPLLMTTVVVTMNPGQWAFVGFTLAWLRLAFAKKHSLWHEHELVRLLRPPELFNRQSESRKLNESEAGTDIHCTQQ